LLCTTGSAIVQTTQYVLCELKCCQMQLNQVSKIASKLFIIVSNKHTYITTYYTLYTLTTTTTKLLLSTSD